MQATIASFKNSTPYRNSALFVRSSSFTNVNNSTPYNSLQVLCLIWKPLHLEARSVPFIADVHHHTDAQENNEKDRQYNNYNPRWNKHVPLSPQIAKQLKCI